MIADKLFLYVEQHAPSVMKEILEIIRPHRLDSVKSILDRHFLKSVRSLTVINERPDAIPIFLLEFCRIIRQNLPQPGDPIGIQLACRITNRFTQQLLDGRAAGSKNNEVTHRALHHQINMFTDMNQIFELSKNKIYSQILVTEDLKQLLSLHDSCIPLFCSSSSGGNLANTGNNPINTGNNPINTGNNLINDDNNDHSTHNSGNSTHDSGNPTHDSNDTAANSSKAFTNNSKCVYINTQRFIVTPAFINGVFRVLYASRKDNLEYLLQHIPIQKVIAVSDIKFVFQKCGITCFFFNLINLLKYQFLKKNSLDTREDFDIVNIIRFMCSSGIPLPVNRNGMRRNPNRTPLEKLCFEAMKQNLAEESVKAITYPVKDSTSKMFFGQRFNEGTGYKFATVFLSEQESILNKKEEFQK